MSNRESNKIALCILNIDQGYAQNTSVRIVKGSLAGCEGKISGCSDGVYFIRMNETNPDQQFANARIDLFVQDEFELLN